jgi:hypothetical protein
VQSRPRSFMSPDGSRVACSTTILPASGPALLIEGSSWCRCGAAAYNVAGMARVYVETTIASFYHEERTEPEMLARRNWTRKWFDAARAGSDELVTSLAVDAELRGGNFPHRDAALSLIADLPLVELDEAVAEIVDAYIVHRVMPKDPQGDALHLAAASFHRCDFLVTWNCRHLANANKFGHIRRVNGILGIGSPVLVTPLELLQEDTSDE